MVVGGVDLGERDRILRLLTPDQGRIDAVARGARGSRRRFAGATDPGTRLAVHLRAGRGALPSIEDLAIRAAPDRARRDLLRIAQLAYGCELCASLAPEHAPAERLHGLCEAWLELLEGEAAPGLASRIALEAKALTFAGLRPHLDRCGRCGEGIEAPAAWDPESGGAVHARCGGGADVALDALHAAEALRRRPMGETVGAPWPWPAWWLAAFARYHAGHALRSLSLLESLEHQGGPA